MNNKEKDFMWAPWNRPYMSEQAVKNLKDKLVSLGLITPKERKNGNKPSKEDARKTSRVFRVDTRV